MVVVCAAGLKLAVDEDTCTQILRESGFLATGPAAAVNFGNVPEDLDAEETKRFLRKNAAEICGFRAGAGRLRIASDMQP